MTDAKPMLAADSRFEMLVQSVIDYAIYMLDPSGIVSSWNAGAFRLKGYTEDEIIGEHFSRFYTPEDQANGMPRRALETSDREGRFEAEGWRVRKDGSRFWANVVIDPIRDEGGVLIGFAKITRDLSERREAQRMLEETQAAFFQSQKMDAIGQLTGGVAHDFNNLLAAVIGSLDLARRRLATGGDAARFIDNAMMAAERGASLTQRMLAFARKQDLKLASIDLSVLVRGMADLFQRTLGPGVAIETRFPLVLKPIEGDPGQLELALLNLAINARDAMPLGGTITIAAREQRIDRDGQQGPVGLVPGDYIRLTVSDTGTGMDDATLVRAMEPFFTTKGVGKGTGLGLSMVHGLAEQSGGQMVLTSEEGVGTSVELWLRVAALPATIGTRDAPGSVVIPRAGQRTVLAVDDDPLVLTNTTAMLEDLGHHVLQAGSDAEAIVILERQSVGLLLTDYAMPEMTGVQLAETVGQKWPGLPVLIVSGYAEIPPDIASDIPRLAKPFREEQLATAIRAVSRTRRPKAKVLAFPVLRA